MSARDVLIPVNSVAEVDTLLTMASKVGWTYDEFRPTRKERTKALLFCKSGPPGEIDSYSNVWAWDASPAVRVLHTWGEISEFLGKPPKKQSVDLTVNHRKITVEASCFRYTARNMVVPKELLQTVYEEAKYVRTHHMRTVTNPGLCEELRVVVPSIAASRALQQLAFSYGYRWTGDETAILHDLIGILSFRSNSHQIVLCDANIGRALETDWMSIVKFLSINAPLFPQPHKDLWLDLHDDGSVQIGCQHISFADLEGVWNAMVELGKE